MEKRRKWRFDANSKLFRNVALLALLVIGTAPVLADTERVPVDLTKVSIEGGANAPVTAQPRIVNYQGQQYSGVTLTLRKAKSYNAIRFPVSVSARPYNTLQFKASFDVADPAQHGLSVAVLDKSKTADGTALRKYARLGDDGWYQFSWDVIYAPDSVGGADLSAITAVQFKYPFSKIPEGQTVEITIIDMNFVSGLRVKSGDPELFEQWTNYIQNYKPDYSDSSKYLQPPATGRLSTPIALTQDGKTAAQIVVPAGANSVLSLAGKELSYWLGEITGAQFPVVEKADAGSAPHIFLGTAPAQAKYSADIQWLGRSDGFAVRADGKDIYIFGATDKGTLNGVFTFLENNTDIIWPRPRLEMGAVFSKNPNLKVLWADAREKPATRLRGWATNLGRRSEHEIWSVRNRDNYPKGGGGAKSDGDARAANGDYVEFGGGHNISGFLGKDNPQRFWPVIDGKVPDKFNIWKHQPNFTAPGIADAVAENVLKYIAEKGPSHIDCININIEDNWGLSTDPKSLEPIKLPDGTLLPNTDPAFRSTQFFIFLNQVARKIRQVHPNLMVGTYAYFFTSTPPKVPLEDNIRVYFCPYVRKDQRSPLSAPINNHWWWRLEAWAKATPNLVMREYYGIGNGYRPLAETVAFDLKSYVARGVREYTSELNPDETVLWSDGKMRGGGDEWDFMAMEFWIINRLYWDPNQDVEQLRKYYLRRTYREAAPAMEKFFGTMRVRWYSLRRASSFEDPDNAMRMLVVSAKSEDELRGYLEEAAKLARHPVSKLQVDVLRQRFESWLRLAKKTRASASSSGMPAAVSRVLYYGWGSNNDWGGSAIWTTPTSIELDGKLAQAVRVNLVPQRFGTKDPSIVTAGLAGVQPGSELSFVVRPLPGEKAPRLVLTARDKKNARISAPETAFETRPDGSVQVRWKLASPEDARKKFNPSETGRVTLAVVKESVESQEPTRFYLTDFEVRPAEQS